MATTDIAVALPPTPRNPEGSSAAIRTMPYPYRCMLAICSDLDETPDRSVYWESHRFLNTTEQTSMGLGVGLEVGNTIYFDMAADQFAYWNTDDAGRARVRALVQSGHIDCLHSFGDLATTRGHAARALEELARFDCGLRVWIDHAVAPTNFGADRMRGEGDVPGAVAFHADLTVGFGVRYVWRGRVTSVIGQNAPRSVAGILNPWRPAGSAVTIGKELAKGVLGRCGSNRYSIHVDNRLMVRTRLRSGHDVYEFLRSNPSWAGISRFDTSDGFADVVTDRFIDRLETRRGFSILYTHLGKISSRAEPFGPSTRKAFRRLAQAQAEGRVLVTTTRRLLDYSCFVSSARLAAGTDGVRTNLDITGTDADGTPLTPREMDGLTIYVPDPVSATLRVNGIEAPELIRNTPDETGQPSISLPWRRLSFPAM